MMSKLLEDSQILGGVFWCFSWKVQLRRCRWHVPATSLLGVVTSCFSCITLVISVLPYFSSGKICVLIGLLPKYSLLQRCKGALVLRSHSPKLVIPQNHSYFLWILGCGSPLACFSIFSFRDSLTFFCLFLEFLFVFLDLFGFRKSLFYCFQGFRVEMVRQYVCFVCSFDPVFLFLIKRINVYGKVTKYIVIKITFIFAYDYFF